jgi:fluoride exporter
MNRHIIGFVLVFVGGGVGSMLRHASNQISLSLLGPDFPYGTMFVNITGSFLMGLLAGWFALRGTGGQMVPLFLTTGILGGFTTFSTFTLDVAVLWERGQVAAATAYVAGSLVTATIGIFSGLALTRVLLGR